MSAREISSAGWSRWVRSAREMLESGSLLVVLFAGAMILAPMAYELARGWAIVGEADYVRVLRRLMLLAVAVWLAIRFSPWKDGGFASYGLSPSARPLRSMSEGALLAFVILIGLLGWQMLNGAIVWESPLSAAKISSRVWKSFLSASFTAAIEEWFFRGWMERRLTRRIPRFSATLIVALVFAVIHAFSPLSVPVPASAAGSLITIEAWFQHLFDPREFGPTFVGLFLFSIILSRVNQRTGSIASSAGFHFVAVLVSYSYHSVTDRVYDSPWIGGHPIIERPITWLVLVATILLLRLPERASEKARQNRVVSLPAGADA